MKAIGLVLLVFLCTVTYPTSAMHNPGTISTEDTTGIITLPVRWLDFKIIQHDNSVLLNWSTLHEQGIKRFTIERSDRGNDFREIGSVIANGNSSTYLDYQFEDLEPIPGHSYYRVTCEDENGFQTISLIRKVNYNKVRISTQFELRNIYVNCKTIHFSPVFHRENQSRIYLYTRSGRLALTAIVNNHTTQVDGSTLKGGIYFLSTGYETRSIIIGD